MGRIFLPMRKLAFLVTLAGIASVALALNRPPVEQLIEGQVRCGTNKACIGGKGGDGKIPDIEVGSPLLLDKPIYPAGAQSVVNVDGGLSVAGAVIVGGNTTVKGTAQLTTLAVGVADAGAVTKVFPFAVTSQDFASTTTTCNDSGGTTVTGVKTGDSCFVGVPSTGGSANATYSCYVSAADTVKVRHCAAGTADDPASATFNGFVFSTQ